MELCGRGGSLLAAKGAAGEWGLRRAWLRLRGNAALGGRRGMSTGRYAGGRQDQQQDWSHRNKTVLTYLAAGVVGMAGVSYAAVPLYRLYCQATGLGGTAVTGHGSDQIETMECIKDRVLKITFNADVHSSLQWNFRPQQTEVYVVPGETALAFYKAKNPTDKPVIGISTYNVVPFEAGQYFNKIQVGSLQTLLLHLSKENRLVGFMCIPYIQHLRTVESDSSRPHGPDHLFDGRKCFCFEEQRLNPHEEVDMPVFFFIDPEFAEDPRMANVNLITLSYTFFEAKEGHKLPLPGYK